MNLKRYGGGRTRRGSTAAVVLLVIAAICLIVGAAGIYFAYSGFKNIMGIVVGVGESPTKLASPGEIEVTGGPGAIFIAARTSDEVDGKAYTYSPSTAVAITVVDDSGNAMQRVDQGNAGASGPIPLSDGGQLYIVGVYEAKGAGKYTIKATGAETALRLKFLEGPDAQGALKGVMSMGGGGLSAVCGCGGFLVFGIIGGILLLFGKKKTAAVV